MDKVIHNKNIFPVVLSSLALCTGMFLSSSFVSAETDVVDEINITVPVSCTLSGTGMNTHNANIANGTYQANIGTTTLKAFCNDAEGFAIYATGYTGDTIGETNSNKLVGASTNTTIETGTATTTGNPDVSNWAMKLNTTTSPTPTYPITIDNSFNDYHAVPNTYTKVAHRDSGTDIGASATGAELTTTYAAYISKTQPADTYSGQVIYTLVHPSDAGAPPQPQQATAGCINYFANAGNAEGTMGCQSATDGNTITLLASNFSRDGYGFAGWSDKYDYATNPNANLYGPQEDITVPEGTTAHGLSLYAIWIESEGSIQDATKVAEVCNRLTQSGPNVTKTLASVSALTDQRDNDTYAIAKLADGNCWMIENLRLDNAAELTITNTNNPLNDGINVALKHNYADADTYNTLSATSTIAYDATTAPDGWCKTNSAACDDQSRLRTDNTINRATGSPTSDTGPMYSYGNYYNWYSATAGRGTYGKTSGAVVGDLCPSGWKLPSGTGYNSGGFDYLNYKLNNNSYTSDSTASKKLRTYPNSFLYSGAVSGASLSSRSGYGGYWSSTANSGYEASYLRVDSSSVGTGGNYKYYGRTIRCIASQ